MADDDDLAQLGLDDEGGAAASQPMEVDETVINNMEDECLCQSERCKQLALSTALDQILDPGLVYVSRHLPDKIWPILGSAAVGSPDPAAYLEQLAQYRIKRHCALAWPTGCIAYRCRTCSVLPSMSLCTDCFRAGNHQGHDYNMFKSRCGGACDCGFDIVDASGHCSNHGRNAKAPKANEPVPAQLTCVPTRAMPRLLSRLVISLRRHAVGQTVETDVYLDFLLGIVNSSAILKDIIIQALLSEEAYSSQMKLLINHPDSRASKIVRESLKILKRERKKLVAFKIPTSWPPTSRTINAFCDKSPHKTFLEELVFWMIAHEFNQKLVYFLLGFLMDKKYKIAFSKLFVNYYPNISMCLASSATDPRGNQQDSFENLPPRILQITVQIYNDSDLTKMLCEEEMPLHLLIYCIRIMIEGSQSDGIFSALKTNPLCKHDSNAPKVVCCDNIILRDRLLSSFTEDMITILDLDHEANRLLSDKNLLQTWLEFVSYFQTMSPHKRELNEHAPYETSPRQSVFMMESEFCLVPLWTLLNHLRDLESVSLSRQLLESIHENLASWLYRMSIGPHSKLDTYFMSFHIPLHRMMAATIRHMIYVQRVPEDQIFSWLSRNQLVLGSKFSYRSAQGARVAIKIEDFIKMLLLHPLQALNLYHQTRSGMWTRNGILTVNQAITYVHCAYCHSIIDMDMFFLRYFSSKLKPDTFLKSLLQRFYAWHCLSFTCGPIFSDTTMDALRVHYYFNIQPEQITQMVESCLVTLIQLLTLDNHCDISSREQTRQEMICLISVAHRSYSYLLDMLPIVSEHHRNEEMLNSLLDELTVYKPASHGTGGNLQQGYYTLKPEIWDNDYNPIQVLYRYYQRRDYQQSLDRFFQHAKSAGKLNRRSHSSALWPPLRIPAKIADFGPIDLGALVRCQTLLGTIFSILYKSIYFEEIPDSMMAYTIHLLELALRKQLERESERANNEMEHDSKEFEHNVSFVGKYSYRELISYYENMPKDEALLRGRTIYSLFADRTSETEPQSNVRLFPFVKHALDLSFDATWFPFDSVIKNCLVHIETVHSLPRDEFDAMIQCTNSEKSGNESASEEISYATGLSSERVSEQNFTDLSTSSSTRSIESQTGVWSNLIGLEVEEVDDIVIEVDADDEEEGDEMIEIDDLNGEEDETVYVEDSSELELSILSHLADSVPSPSASSLGASNANRPSEAGTSTSSAPTATESSSPMASVERDASRASAPHGWPPSLVALSRPDAAEPNPADRQDINIEGYIRLRDYMDRLGAQNLQANQSNLAPENTLGAAASSAPIHDDGAARVQLQAQAAADEFENNLAQPGQTSRTLPAQSNETSSHGSRLTWTPFQQQQPPPLPPAQPQNLITERRAILNSSPRHMITNSPQPLALEGAVATPTLSLTRATVVVNANESGTSSGGGGSSSNDTLNQERQLVGRSLRPQIGLSAFNQNVTRSLGECTADLTELRQRQAANQIEGSLTEIDIQARFTGFFSSDTSSSASASSRVNANRIIRPRQMARRGNYRGAYLTEPYLLYNNLNNNNNNNNNTTNNNNNNNNNNTNNNNNESVHELVRRSVAVVPAITDAIRSTIQQRVENLATARGTTTTTTATTTTMAATAPSPSGNANQTAASAPTRTAAATAASAEAPREPPSESPRSSSNSPPPPNPSAAGGDQRRSRPFYLRDPISLVPDGYRSANRFITTRRSTQQQIPTDQRTRRLRKEHRQHHGESILTLLLRLHAKYSHQPRSYHYDELRASTNLDPMRRCRIGDGSHFLTIVLDLICASDVQHKERVEYLTELIWPRQSNEPKTERDATSVGVGEYEGRRARGDVGGVTSNDVEIESSSSSKTKRSGGKSGCSQPEADGDKMRPSPVAATSSFGLNLSNTVKSEPTTTKSSSNPLALLTPEEKRHRAKERQTRLMAEFASKQRAFMAKYAANISPAAPSSATASAGAAEANPGRSGLGSESSGPSTSTMAYGSQKYGSERTAMQTGDKMSCMASGDPHSAERYEEQPINLSSKSNQGQASRSQSTYDAGSNNEQTAQRAAAGHSARVSDEARVLSASSVTISDKGDVPSRPAASSTGDDGHSPIGGPARSDDRLHQQSMPAAAKCPSGSSFHNPSTSQGHFGGAVDDQVAAAAADDPNECCICGLGALDNSTKNPLGIVVLLQSTSVYGHSHLRPRSERKLPCDEMEHSKLKEETYAKYLERRIDILSDHFTKSSWLDAINIGAEGGVHVQSCGHHLHIECHQSYIRSLDQEDGMRVRNESDEFQCPVCRQLANSVLPILNDEFHSGSNRAGFSQAFTSVAGISELLPAKKTTKITPLTEQDHHSRRHQDDDPGCQQPPAAGRSSWVTNCGDGVAGSGFSRSQASDFGALMPSVSFDDQIARVSLQLRDRRAPNQRELQSSAAFCSHLTKATGPQYRLIRTVPSMHSLFLFLSSIARTNLEAGLIIRQIDRPSARLSSGSTNLPGAHQQHQSPACSSGSGEFAQAAARPLKGKHTCFQLLFRVLALNARTLMNDQWCSYEHIWSRLTHHVPEADRLSIRPHDSEVPLLLRDPVAMLLQFMFTISGSKINGRELFACLVRVLFNLTVIQSAALVLSYVKSVPELIDELMQCPTDQPTQVPSEENSTANLPASQIDRSQNAIISNEQQKHHHHQQQQQQEATDERERAADDANDVRNYRQTIQLEGLLRLLWRNLSPLLTKDNEEPLMNSVVRDSWSRLAGNCEDASWWQVDLEQWPQWARDSKETVNKELKLRYVENKIKLACTPFLRAAAFLQQHLFGQPNPRLRCEMDEKSLTNPSHIEEDFSDLIRCLELESARRSALSQQQQQRRTEANAKREKLQPDAHIALQQCLDWPSSAGLMGRDLVASWALELLQLARQYSIAARTLLLSRPLTWHRPALMQLPHSFDDIFMFYYRRKCSLCQQVPKDVAVCLVCGAPICFRASCCKDRSRSRQVHSQHCGANTAVFLAVHTSAVVVIRGNRACVWGSVYLDAHDEEDNGLQRGKPLYMVPARFALLEQQWLSHAFDHTCGKRWIYLQEAQ